MMGRFNLVVNSSPFLNHSRLITKKKLTKKTDWKARFGAESISEVVQGTLTSRAPKYSIILDLDRKIRDTELPLYAQGQPPQGKGLGETMSHFMPMNYRELS